MTAANDAVTTPAAKKKIVVTLDDLLRAVKFFEQAPGCEKISYNPENDLLYFQTYSGVTLFRGPTEMGLRIYKNYLRRLHLIAEASLKAEEEKKKNEAHVEEEMRAWENWE